MQAENELKMINDQNDLAEGDGVAQEAHMNGPVADRKTEARRDLCQPFRQCYDKEFRLKIQVKNNRIVMARERLGLSAMAAAKKTGIAYHTWLQYENLNDSPLKKRYRELSRRDFIIDPWRDSALNIAKMLNVMPEYLWPEAVLEIENSRTEIELSAKEIDLLMSDDMRRRIEQANDFENYMIGAIDNVAEAATEVLTDREKHVIDCRYYSEMSLREIGETLDLSPERTRQIEAKALRKMRHSLEIKERESLDDLQG